MSKTKKWLNKELFELPENQKAFDENSQCYEITYEEEV